VTAFFGVAEGNEEQHAQRRAQLGEHGDGSDLRDGDAEAGGDGGEQGLNVIDVGDDGGNADGHQGDMGGADVGWLS